MLTINSFVYLFAFLDVFLTHTDCCDYHETVWNKTVMDLEERMVNALPETTLFAEKHEDSLSQKQRHRHYANRNARLSREVSIKNDAVSKFNFYKQKMNKWSISTFRSTESASNFYGWQHQYQKATPTKDEKQNQMPNSIENVNDSTIVTKPNTVHDHEKEYIAKVDTSITTRKIMFNDVRNGFRVYLFKMVFAFRAFCGGSIITLTRVLTSTNCLLTNKKNLRPGLKGGLRSVHVVAGTLATNIKYDNQSYQQWRTIQKLYSQEFYRHPQYSLTILEVDRPWVFNSIVNRIPFASRDYDFDGVCNAVAVKTSKSWAKFKQLHLAEVKMITRQNCESIFLRNTRVFFCTEYDYDFVLYSVIPGGGLICQNTGDPLEVNENQGILVAVTVQNQYHMPTLHQKVGMFYQWVVDTAHVCYLSWTMLAVVVPVLSYF